MIESQGKIEHCNCNTEHIIHGLSSFVALPWKTQHNEVGQTNSVTQLRLGAMPSPIGMLDRSNIVLQTNS